MQAIKERHSKEGHIDEARESQDQGTDRHANFAAEDELKQEHSKKPERKENEAYAKKEKRMEFFPGR